MTPTELGYHMNFGFLVVPSDGQNLRPPSGEAAAAAAGPLAEATAAAAAGPLREAASLNIPGFGLNKDMWGIIAECAPGEMMSHLLLAQRHDSECTPEIKKFFEEVSRDDINAFCAAMMPNENAAILLADHENMHERINDLCTTMVRKGNGATIGLVMNGLYANGRLADVDALSYFEYAIEAPPGNVKKEVLKILFERLQSLNFWTNRILNESAIRAACQQTDSPDLAKVVLDEQMTRLMNVRAAAELAEDERVVLLIDGFIDSLVKSILEAEPIPLNF